MRRPSRAPARAALARQARHRDLAALREGTPRLVVHDPAVPRSPGGAGEILGLEWWVSVPLAGPQGVPAALWGIGGRASGRLAPPAAMLDALGDAARGDLSDDAQRAALRERLRAPGERGTPCFEMRGGVLQDVPHVHVLIQTPHDRGAAARIGGFR